MELIFKVVMLPITASSLALFNNAEKCRNTVLMRRRVSCICSQPSGHGGKEPAVCASTLISDLKTTVTKSLASLLLLFVRIHK